MTEIAIDPKLVVSQALRGPCRKERAVVVWAFVGLGWVTVCAFALGGWIASPTDFRPAPLLGPDELPYGTLIALRVLEAVSLAVLLVFAYVMVIKPWRRGEGLGLTAWLMVGGVFAFVADASLNLYDYLFAWNQHSVNYGVWAAYMPFHKDGQSSRYAEALLWGLPMYIYFCAGLGLIGAALANKLRLRRPTMSIAGVLAVIWIGDFIFDFVLENLIIRTTQAYAFARTPPELTLFAGSQFQFPIYESFLVAFVACAFTRLRMSAMDDPHGLSFIERGTLDLPVALRQPMRCLAAIGFSATVLVLVYHLPFNWIGLGGTSTIDLPSYMLAG